MWEYLTVKIRSNECTGVLFSHPDNEENYLLNNNIFKQAEKEVMYHAGNAGWELATSLRYIEDHYPVYEHRFKRILTGIDFD